MDAVVALLKLETLLIKCISGITDPVSLYRSFNVIRKKQPTFPMTLLLC